MQTLTHLHWRYATKHFDSTKIVSKDNIDTLYESIRLAPTSYGLQLFKVIVVTDQRIKQQLYEASYHQKQVLDASHMFIFCGYNTIHESDVDSYKNKMLLNANVSKRQSILSYSDAIKRDVLQMTPNEMKEYTSQQTYLALGFLLNACALLKIDACPMTGFEVDKYDEILNLNEKNLHSTVIAPVGYRSENDHAQERTKIRKTTAELFTCL